MKSACPSLANGRQAGPRPASATRHVRVSGNGPGPQAFQDCVTKVAAEFHEVVTYQPASRYWAFQGLETALFLVARPSSRRAVLLVGPPPALVITTDRSARKEADDLADLASVPHVDRGRSLVLLVHDHDHRRGGVTGPHLVHLYDTTVVKTAPPTTTADAEAAFAKERPLPPAVASPRCSLVAPALIGIFLGYSPRRARAQDRELQAGVVTERHPSPLARHQARAGRVWPRCVAAGLLSLMVTWWSRSIRPHRRQPVLARPTSTAATWSPSAMPRSRFALGVAAGVLIRRTLPAMAATLVAFVGVRAAVFAWVRPASDDAR